MRNKLKPSQKITSAFTRTELVVVLMLVIGLAASLMFFLRRDPEPKRRVQCAANLRQLGVALSLYAGEYQDLLPDCTRNNPKFFGSVWPWDLHTNVVAALVGNGASRQEFYCPSNPGMNNEQRWDFFRYDRSPIRVVGYGFLMNGCRQVPPPLWRTNLHGDGIRPPTETELAFDATLSQHGSYDSIRGKWVDRSNHLGRRGRPLGGTILFEDGHSEWRDFQKMQHRIFGDAVWDF